MNSKIENFIRTKYESKRWVMEGPMPDPSTLDAEGDDDVVRASCLYVVTVSHRAKTSEQPLNIVQEKAKLDRSSSQRIPSAPAQPPPPTKKPNQNFDLIGDDIPTPPVRPSTTDNPIIRSPPTKPIAPPSQLLGGLDFFGGPPDRPASASSQPASSTGMSRPDLKQSILSLYASTPKPQPQPQSPTQPHPPQHTGRQPSFGGMQSAAVSNSSAIGGLDDAFSSLKFGNSTSPTAPQPQKQSKPSSFSPFGQLPNQRSTPAAPQMTSTPLSGGGFFDTGTGPKPPPKPAAPKAAAPAALVPRKFSNASSGFGEFSSALNPMSASSIATSTNGLLDLSSPPMIQSARPANNSTTMASVFNLSAPAKPSNYQPVIQSSAPPTKSTFSGVSNNDLWGSGDPWANSEPAAMTPQAQSIRSPSVSSATASDFGWGNSAASAGLSVGGGGGFSIQSSPGDRGFGRSAVSPPKVTVDEDFGGWNTAAPETPASPNPPSISVPRVEPQNQQRQQSFNPPPAEDLFSNVWG